MRYVLQNQKDPSDYAVLQIKSLTTLEDIEMEVATTDDFNGATVFSELTLSCYTEIVKGITNEDWNGLML